MLKQKISHIYKQFILFFKESIRVKKFFSYMAYVSCLIALCFAIVGWYWSQEPTMFSITTEYHKYVTKDNTQLVSGVTTSATLINLVETLLNKPGGFIANDIMPPGIFLDNISSWEIGVLIQIRDISRAMRKDFSRSQSQSKEDPDLAFAEPQFNFDARSWMLPASENEYKKGINKLKSYTDRLISMDDTAHFYPRADNLSRWLADVATRLGSLSQRLSLCIQKSKLEYTNGELIVTNSNNKETTPWLKLDDIVYESRGTAWALIHLLQAIRIDFFDILDKKNALTSIDQIIIELLATQKRILFPMILNASGYSLFSNHSLIISSYISRANIGVVELKKLLEQG